MNVALRKPMTVEAFLEWEERQELKWEFDGWRPVAMAGGTLAHDAIRRGLDSALGGRLKGRPCRPHGPEVKVIVAGRVRYPDLFVVCSPMNPRATVVTDPVVVFEVLSDSTQETDRIEKNREYEATPSIQRYVMLEQGRVAATVFHRAGEDWVGHLLLAGATIDMPEIGVSVPLAEFYEGLEFPPPWADPAGA